MSNFAGGSAYGMVQQIAEGFLLVTERTFKRLTRAEMDKLSFEIDKRVRGIRGEPPPPTEETQEIQKRNRRLQRLNASMMMLRSYRMKRRM